MLVGDILVHVHTCTGTYMYISSYLTCIFIFIMNFDQPLLPTFAKSRSHQIMYMYVKHIEITHCNLGSSPGGVTDDFFSLSYLACNC